MKTLLRSLRPRETRELVADHVNKLSVNQRTNTITLSVDKRYAFNVIIAHDHIRCVIQGVKRAFGDSFQTVIQVAGQHTPSEREKALPRAIHYA